MRKTILTAATAALLAGALTPATPALADDPPPPPAPALHHIRYTVSADGPIWARIYYRDTEPVMFSDYSHNPFQFSPRADVDLGPGQPWVLETMLADPEMWAMVTVQSGEAPNFPTPNFGCVLEVDGVVVKTGSGPKGALCSLRNW
ncbi:hypothetical protein [Mycolicibacterium fallax]|uniref:Uncharacterized protein n=1 Tax=Mycolicibacterium fallax TaxID=1793 RepID=A0A1X1RHZ5_MYCFA|nr:hypothetical protein [Mycolicibacterium fallax]ORV06714.1 hypothetical protein AWC04_04465 [Mycolicibacterium fallax]BBY96667.1 hypothetical protein MFAL_01340 [Mycolicibacterium fallax]HOW94965.1 hypothetical protein [Mycolicibacterium fallax]HSA39351.1 hypothetical protein [Mycobacterium sp.]